MRFLSINPQPIEITVLILKHLKKAQINPVFIDIPLHTVKLSSFAALNA